MAPVTTNDKPTATSLTCESCGQTTLILPGCANTVWLCENCGAAVHTSDPSQPRHENAADNDRPLVTMEMLEDELARLTMSQGAPRRESGDPRLPRIYRATGSFTRIPGDPRVPKLVRVYGVAFTVIGVSAVVLNLYALFFNAFGNPLSSTLLASLLTAAGIGIALFLIVVGNRLQNGRRAAVYGAVAVFIAAVALAAAQFPFASSVIALITIPLVISATRHWNRFH